MRTLLVLLLAAGCHTVVVANPTDGGSTNDLTLGGSHDLAGFDGATGGRDLTSTTSSSLWLHTAGNHIYTADNQVWHGRGADLQDTRGCGACLWGAPSVAEVNRRSDELMDKWHANFTRLTLESYTSAPQGAVQWRGVIDDAAYLADVKATVAHLTAKPGVYVLLSLWVDGTFSSQGWPTSNTHAEWQKLAAEFLDEPKVLFGLVNEPENNFDGSQDAQVWQAMNDTIAAIRAVEDAAGKPHHVITAQGTGGWSRRLGYYVTHPITAGGGDNIAYEVHVYDHESDFNSEWITPAKTIPVVIGEFGPASGYMTEAECTSMMTAARQAEVPHLAWTFHMRCDPNLLVDHSSGGCGIDMPLEPTSWGKVLQAGLAVPW